MEWFTDFYSVLSGDTGTLWQRILYYLCLAVVLIILILILVLISKIRKRKSAKEAASNDVSGENADNSPSKGKKRYVWKDRRRVIFGLPFTFDRYRLTNEKLLLISGFFNIKEDEVKLYRVLDLSLTKTLGQRLFGLGTVTIKSNDKSLPLVVLKNIKKPKKVKELLSDLVEKERLAKKVGSNEMMGLHGGPIDVDGNGFPDMPDSPI